MQDESGYKEYELQHELIEIQRRAESRLISVGLVWEDLPDGQVLDIGSGDCDIEIAGRQKGFTNIISIDTRFSARANRHLSLEGREMSAEELQYPDNSIELALSFSGPLFIPNSEISVVLQLEELHRVLAIDGEARIYPPRIGFITESVKRGYPEVQAILDKGLRRSGDESRQLARFREEILTRSTEFLLGKGYKVQLIDNLKASGEDGNNFYWKINK